MPKWFFQEKLLQFCYQGTKRNSVFTESGGRVDLRPQRGSKAKRLKATQSCSVHTSEVWVWSELSGGWAEKQGATLSQCLCHHAFFPKLPTSFLSRQDTDYTGSIQRIQDNCKFFNPTCKVPFASRFQGKAVDRVGSYCSAHRDAMKS